ncbi:MAG TPA: IS66 family transposase [Streptosporangiaceae bacterium]|nr:IS66 family transposase [Streptosporangiaceae bacterium]HVB42378.1 IS66 family transposase [Streptosporangiaceae bacterium]
MSDEPDLPGGAGEQRELLARLRAVVEAKDTEITVLRAELSAGLGRERRFELRIAELERRLGMDSSNSGTPSSKEPIGAKERRKAERRARDASERERRRDRKRGGQPGHRGAGLSRDPEPDERKTADPSAECSGCGAALAGVRPAGSKWAQVWDVRISRWVTEWLLPSLPCPCCGKLTTADAPPGAHPGTISYGPGINAAAVLLSGYGNVPSERAARLIAMLLGMPVSPGFVDRASARLDEILQAAGFDDAMQAALADEPVLGADETPVNVLTRDADPETGEPEEGAPHVLIVRPPGGKLTWLRAMSSRRAAAITAILSFFTGILITDGYTACQQMLGDLAGIQQCAAHVIRRCRAVSKLGPGSLQSWAEDVIIILRQAHLACEDARSRGKPPDPQAIKDLRARYDEAVSFGITHNRHRDWHDGNHPGYALGSWLHGYAGQVWLFTSQPAVEWTNNVSERGAKAAKRHQAVSGYWHTQHTLARWCRIRGYLDSATAHGHTALDAVSTALAGKPWLPPLPAGDLLAA